MESIEIYMGGSLVPPPKNLNGLSIELNFDKEKASEQLVINDLEFVRENYDKITAYRNSGLTGGTGVLEGYPLSIKIKDGALYETPFDGYIDLTEETFYDPGDAGSVSVKIKESGNIDWLNDNIDSFRMEYLKSIGEILPTDYIFMPYVIDSPEGLAEQIALIEFQIAFTTLSLYQQIADLAQIIIAAANPFEATALIRVIVMIAYIIVLILALIKLYKDFIQLVLQPVKYHACMTVKLQLTKGFYHLGLQFESPFFEVGAETENLTIMPEKNYVAVNTDDKRIYGFTSPSVDQQGFYKGLFGDLVREVKKYFNAKLVIKSGVVNLVRIDEYISPAAYQIPNIYNPRYQLNLREFKSNYSIDFGYDLIEKNTIQEYGGTSFESMLRPQVINNPKMVLMKGSENIKINFALAKIKTELTIPETLIKDLLNVIDGILNAIIKVVNAVIKVYNDVAQKINKIIDKLDTIGITLNIELKTIDPLQKFDLSNIIENRIGMMKLQSDQTSMPKIFLIIIGSSPKFNKIKSSNHDSVNAKYLWDNYHYVNSFLPTTDRPNGNQYFIKQADNVPFSLADFLNVKDNNNISNNQGVNGEIISLKWNPFKQTASINYKINQLYTKNLIEIRLYPDGR